VNATQKFQYTKICKDTHHNDKKPQKQAKTTQPSTTERLTRKEEHEDI
jgi:hypothetical protein